MPLILNGRPPFVKPVSCRARFPNSGLGVEGDEAYEGYEGKTLIGVVVLLPTTGRTSFGVGG